MRPILIALLFFIPLVATAEQCAITEKSLVGVWKRKSEFGFFEEMSFEIDKKQKIFDSWLHQRPEISGGNWKLANCTVFISHPTEKNLSFKLDVVKASKERIYFREVGENGISVYQRIE